MTVRIGSALAAAADRLAAAGVPSPRVDAELLLAHVLGVPRSRLLTVPPLSAEQHTEWDALVARRASREPLQHLTGTAPFRYADLAVGPGVFVPRPETELLVDVVLPYLRQRVGGARVVDLGAGSGALAVSIAAEVPDARVIAVERSADALVWLRRNAGDRVTVVPGDVQDPRLLAQLGGRVDVVVSNPPYVPDAVAVAPEVRADPAAAVFAGPDGLAVIPAVIERAAWLLRSGGVLALEHDESHQERVLALLADGSWRDAAGHDDLSGRPRFVTAVRA